MLSGKRFQRLDAEMQKACALTLSPLYSAFSTAT